VFFLYLLRYGIDYGFDLTVTLAAANDKIICKSTNFPDIQKYSIYGLFITNDINNFMG